MVVQAGLMLTFAFVYVLVELGLPTWASFLIVAGVFLLIAAIAGAIAYRKAQGIKGPKVAQEELAKTVDAVASLGGTSTLPARTQ
jgi:uncharacterized protein (DUF983 family)